MSADALTKGTESMGATEYEDFLSDRAASLSAGAGRDVFVVSAKYPVRFEDDMIALFEETLKNPAFEEREIDRVRQEQMADIEQKKDRAMGLAFRRMFPFLFPGSKYGFLHLGADEILKTLGKDQVSDYWSRQRNEPWVMAASGAYDRERVVELAKRLARGASEAKIDFPDPEWGGDEELKLDMPGRNQTHLLAVFPVPGVLHENTASLRLLDKALSGQGGMLFRELREEKGLGYSVSAMLWQTQHVGFLAFYIGTSPEGAPQAMQGFKDIAGRLGREELPQEEISRAKNLIKGEYYRSHQSLSSRSREAAGLTLRGLPLDHNRKLVDKARELSAEELRKIAAEYLDWDRAYVIRIEPSEGEGG
jgi:zinc protease